MNDKSRQPEETYSLADKKAFVPRYNLSFKVKDQKALFLVVPPGIRKIQLVYKPFTDRADIFANKCCELLNLAYPNRESIELKLAAIPQVQRFDCPLKDGLYMFKNCLGDRKHYIQSRGSSISLYIFRDNYIVAEFDNTVCEKINIVKNNREVFLYVDCVPTDIEVYKTVSLNKKDTAVFQDEELSRLLLKKASPFFIDETHDSVGYWANFVYSGKGTLFTLIE